MRSVHTSASTQLHFWLSASLPCLSPPLSTVPLASSLTLHIHLPGGPSLHRQPGFFTTTPPLTSAGLLPDRPFADLLALRHLNFPPFHLQPPQAILFHDRTTEGPPTLGTSRVAEAWEPPPRGDLIELSTFEPSAAQCASTSPSDVQGKSQACQGTAMSKANNF